MLLLNLGVLDGWTYRTVGICQRAKKAFRVVQLENVEDAMVRAVRSWLLTDQIAVLYVTGPRESKRPGIAAATARFFDRLIDSA